VNDFEDKELGNVVPYGIDGRRCACRRSSQSVGARRQAAMPLVDVGTNADFVSVGIIQ
jgi:hypothetical protein